MTATAIVVTALLSDGETMAEFMLSSPPAAAGGVVSFRGVVRDHDRGRGVAALEYEAHPDAARALRDITATVASGHPDVVAIRVAHRIGALAIGECALFAEVFAPHRGEAFAACAELVDEVKRLLPVWKRQIFTDGSDEWVNSP